MDEEEVILEEGELSDDSDSDTYTPLERPVDYALSQPNPRFPVVQESDSEPELQSSDSDSDSDTGRKKSKKPKIKLKPQRVQPNKQKKYDIWSTRVQEEVLAETLNSCDVTIKDRSRSVETYDYMSHRVNNKRSRDDRVNPYIKSVGRAKSQERKGSGRSIEDLVVNEKNSPEEIAKDIANKLSEEKEDLILRVINTLGIDKTFFIFKETKRIEEEGGMLIMNQTRRRTPGGVFLFLVRHDYHITADQKNKIFEDEKEKSKVTLRNKQKKKLKKLKQEIAASRSKLLPDLLSRAELLAKENNRNRRETDERDVINPPPTPETDGGHENSGDGMEEDGRRKCDSYEEDFLDITSNDMDLF